MEGTAIAKEVCGFLVKEVVAIHKIKKLGPIVHRKLDGMQATLEKCASKIKDDPSDKVPKDVINVLQQARGVIEVAKATKKGYFKQKKLRAMKKAAAEVSHAPRSHASPMRPVVVKRLHSQT